MDSTPQQSADSPPPKPWERAGAPSSSAPFKPPSPGSTSDVVEGSGTAKPGEIVSNSNKNTTINRNVVGKPVPTRPWEQSYGNRNYGGYGSGAYGLYGGFGGSYGGGMYGNTMYRGGYGGLYGSPGMCGGGLYNGGPYGAQDPNNPDTAPPSPPGFWISFLRVVQRVVEIFGRIAILIDQNTQAVHLFMSALLQLIDRSGLLYGELARFVLRLLGIRAKPSKVHPPGPDGLPVPGPQNTHTAQNHIEEAKAAPTGSWENVWGNDASK